MADPVRVAPPAPLVGSGAWLVFDAWLRRAREVIGESADALNAMNVFPISDADTGSNLRLTLAGIARAVPDVNRTSADAVVQAAILSAHGSSGAIVAEMFSSVCRSLGQASATPAGGGAGDQMALLLRTVADAARRAVAQPIAGTILTVAEDAARAAGLAARQHPDDALAVAEAAQAESRLALQRTPDQLEVLAAAGVVDAGGQAFALLVDALVEVLGGAPARPLDPVVATPRPAAAAGPAFEVMYAVRGAGADALDRLRDVLSGLGESVVVVGTGAAAGGLAQVHVHVDDPGPAIEAALGLGELSQIRVSTLEPAASGRSVVAVVAGPGLQQAVAAAGAVAVLGTPGRPVLEELTAALARTAGDVVILPNDMETLEAAGHLVSRLRAERRAGPRPRRLAVVPTVAQVQGLAALAVHEPEADFDAAVAAMSSAAGHTRHGAVTVAEAATMTMRGRCAPGTVLGAVEGDFVETGSEVAAVAWRVVERLLAAGGELLTLVLGEAAPTGLAEELTRRLGEHAPSVEVQVIPGGQPRYLVLVGLE